MTDHKHDEKPLSDLYPTCSHAMSIKEAWARAEKAIHMHAKINKRLPPSSDTINYLRTVFYGGAASYDIIYRCTEGRFKDKELSADNAHRIMDSVAEEIEEVLVEHLGEKLDKTFDDLLDAIEKAAKK